MANRKRNKRGTRRNRRNPRQTQPRRQGQRSQARVAQATAPPSGSTPCGPQPQFEWVTIEHRDIDGNLTFPESLIQSTYPRRYSEVEDGTQIRGLVLTGYKPHALMLVERKIYEVRQLSLDGWRRQGQIHVELDGWRVHEEHWFSAMQGVSIEITDPSQPRPTKGETYRVTKTNFEKKKVSTHHRDGTVKELSLYGGTLDITETWKSAWRRHRARVIDSALRYVVLPFSVAFGAGVAILWFQGPSDGDDEPHDSTIREAPSMEAGPTIPGDGSVDTQTSAHSNTRSEPAEAHIPEVVDYQEPDAATTSDQVLP